MLNKLLFTSNLVVHVVMTEWDMNIHSSQCSMSTVYELSCTYLFTVDCGAPGNPQRGSTNYTNTTKGSVAFYSCDQHLVPVGRMMTNCTRNGWSPLDPGHLSCTEGMLTGNCLC